MIAALPAPKIQATRLKLNRPTSNQTSAPIITSENAIIVVIFIITPLMGVWAKIVVICIKQRYFLKQVYQNQCSLQSHPLKI